MNKINFKKENISERSKSQKERWEKTVSENKEKIKDSAIKIFTENGFDKTQVIDIIRESGISKATVYKYCNSDDQRDIKENMFLLAGSEGLEKLNACFEKNKNKKGFRVITDGLIEFMTHHIELADIINHKFYRRVYAEINEKRNNNKMVSEFEQEFENHQLKSATYLINALKYVFEEKKIEVSDSEILNLSTSLSTIINGFTNEFIQRKLFLLQTNEEIKDQFNILFKILEIGIVGYYSSI